VRGFSNTAHPPDTALHFTHVAMRLDAIYPILISCIPLCVAHSARQTKNALKVNSCGGLSRRLIPLGVRTFLCKVTGQFQDCAASRYWAWQGHGAWADSMRKCCIGHAKAFGCGLLLVRRIWANTCGLASLI